MKTARDYVEELERRPDDWDSVKEMVESIIIQAQKEAVDRFVSQLKIEHFFVSPISGELILLFDIEKFKNQLK